MTLTLVTPLTSRAKYHISLEKSLATYKVVTSYFEDVMSPAGSLATISSGSQSLASPSIVITLESLISVIGIIVLLAEVSANHISSAKPFLDRYFSMDDSSKAIGHPS